MKELFRKNFSIAASNLELFFRWFVIIYVAIALTFSPFCLVLIGKYFNVHDSIQREVDKRDTFMAKQNFRWNDVSNTYEPTNGTNIELYGGRK